MLPPEQIEREPGGVSAALTWPGVRRPTALALMLHGGQPDGAVPVTAVDPALLRMRPFVWDVQARSRGRVGAALLRNAVRGWDAAGHSSVDDALWAIEQLRERYPGLPITLVGHSMGGRTAFALAGRTELAGIAALAPWRADAYPAAQFTGAPLLVAHGERDHLTDAEASRDLVERVTAAGGDARFVSMSGGHTMTWNPQAWHRLTSRFVIDLTQPVAH